MFRLWMRDPTSSAYNSGFTAVLQGQLDVAALQSAAQLMFERQQSLRTRFVMKGEVPMQRIVPAGTRGDCLPVEELSLDGDALPLGADGSYQLQTGQ